MHTAIIFPKWVFSVCYNHSKQCSSALQIPVERVVILSTVNFKGGDKIIFHEPNNVQTILEI